MFYLTVWRPRARILPPIALLATGDGLWRVGYGIPDRRRALRWAARIVDSPPTWTRVRFQPALQFLDRFAAGRDPGRPPRFDRALGTPLQQRIWRAASRIPWGATCSYGDVARRLGRPTLARAVGQAMAHNPLAPFVPCHRIVGAHGLGGFGGGLSAKRRLLAHEQRRRRGPAH